ncbi:CoA transferase [Actinocatenispora rupis]|uniref:CoA-transferase family III n=1 Tax=Actinocatenispora rupis TaxID=519421 RepID=A0A8J3JC58_9ACTN|nr:CoA transferase [Actinocatenispora rupis]GID15737.1 hypothetical protein Aru02nite_66260 [Actinocatenispora rupis]
MRGPTATSTRPATVAATVAAGHLRALGAADTGYDIGWAGPVDLPLDDEASVQAACGLAAVHGRRYGRPEPLRVPYASVLAGVLAAQGALAAQLDRRRGGPARRVATSVAQAALLAVGQHLASATTADDGAPPAGTGGPPFVSADGVRFEIESLYAEGWARFWSRLGADTGAVRRGWPPFQGRFATATCPLPAALHDTTRRHPYEEVRAAGADAGVTVVAVRTGPAGTGEVPWRFAELGAAVPTPPPAAGDAPLHGFVVVEATRRVQGPLAGHLLRLLGADVVRVEPPGGDPMRGVPPMAGDVSARFLALNRGKRVVAADLGHAAGRAELRELVAGADVFLHNWAPGRAARWGLDADDLAAVRPGLVFAYASGWGAAPGADPPVGTDYVVQASSGLAARLGPDDATPTPSLYTVTDTLGALVCVEAVLAALLHRLRTGYGRRVDTSLLSAAGVLLAAPRTAPAAPRVPVCTDLAELAGDPRFADALTYDGCALVRAPWRFTPA